MLIVSQTQNPSQKSSYVTRTDTAGQSPDNIMKKTLESGP